MDLIDRQAAIDAFNTNLNELVVGGEENAKTVENYLNRVLDKIKCLPSALSTNLAEVGTDCISRQAAIDALRKKQDNGKGDISRFYNTIIQHDIEAIMALPSAQPETAKRIVGKSRDGMTLWYQCDMCNEPVDVQDNYCCGCGRRLIDE